MRVSKINLVLSFLFTIFAIPKTKNNMMTMLEQKFYDLACAFFHKFINKEIDWEQRRYEIAKDMFTSTFFGGNNGTPTGWLSSYPNTAQQMATNAVKYADALINELKKGDNK